jgi:NADP-reducing hydrogenase subunit HndB
MTAIQSLEDLERFKQEVLAERASLARSGVIQVVVSMGSCGIAAGALDTYTAVKELIEREHLDKVELSKTGCIGLCREEPLLQVITSEGHKTTYGHATPEVVSRIVREHILDGKIVLEHAITV